MVNISNTVMAGEILMSVKLAEMLELEEDECVEVVCAKKSDNTTTSATS